MPASIRIFRRQVANKSREINDDCRLAKLPAEGQIVTRPGKRASRNVRCYRLRPRFCRPHPNAGIECFPSANLVADSNVDLASDSRFGPEGAWKTQWNLFVTAQVLIVSNVLHGTEKSRMIREIYESSPCNTGSMAPADQARS